MHSVPISNARLIAELQALTIGIHLVGLDRLPKVMSGGDLKLAGYEGEAVVNPNPVADSTGKGRG